MKLLDLYIIKRYLGTFIVMILLFIPIGIMVDVAEKIDKLNKSIGLNHIMLLQQFPGFEYQKILKSMALFSEKVMPRFNPDGV